MKIFDITLPIQNNLPVWPGDDPVRLQRVSKIEEGDVVNISSVAMSVHTGTHVDAPFHFLSNGSTIEEMNLEVLIGTVQVFEIPSECRVIDKPVIDSLEFGRNISRVLFKTTNSNLWNGKEKGFDTSFVGISEDASNELIRRGIQLVGIDYLSIAPFEQTIPTHMALLSSKVIIIEGLDLRMVSAGYYTIYCLPLKLEKSDGAPARVILIQD